MLHSSTTTTTHISTATVPRFCGHQLLLRGIHNGYGRLGPLRHLLVVVEEMVVAHQHVLRCRIKVGDAASHRRKTVGSGCRRRTGQQYGGIRMVMAITRSTRGRH